MKQLDTKDFGSLKIALITHSKISINPTLMINYLYWFMTDYL